MITRIFQAIAASAVVPRIANIFAPITTIFSAIEDIFSPVAAILVPITHVFATIAYIFDMIAHATPRWLTIGGRSDCYYEYRCANGKEQFG